MSYISNMAVEYHHSSPPLTFSTSRLAERLERSHRNSLKPDRLVGFLESYLEPVSVRPDIIYRRYNSLVSTTLWAGPLHMKGWTPKGYERFNVSLPLEGYGGGVMIRLPWSRLRAFKMMVFAWRISAAYTSFSLRWNLSCVRIVGWNAPITVLTCCGDVSEMKRLFKAGLASPSDMLPDSTSLLHVWCISSSCLTSMMLN